MLTGVEGARTPLPSNGECAFVSFYVIGSSSGSITINSIEVNPRCVVAEGMIPGPCHGSDSSC